MFKVLSTAAANAIPLGNLPLLAKLQSVLQAHEQLCQTEHPEHLDGQHWSRQLLDSKSMVALVTLSFIMLIIACDTAT
eukprot:1147458-Amphidinium_carterae.1